MNESEHTAKTILKTLFYILTIIFAISPGYAGAQIKVHTDFIYIKDQLAYLDLFFESDITGSFTLNFECVKKSDKNFEEIKIAVLKPFPVKLNKGVNKIQINLSDKRFGTSNESFLNVIRKYETVPVGNYEIKVNIIGEQTIIESTILRGVDTLLKAESAFVKQVKENLDKGIKSTKNSKVNTELANIRTNKRLAKQGLTSITRTIGHSQYMYLYAEKWLLGCYILPDSSLEKRGQIQEMITEKKEAIVQSGLETYESIFSQIKKDKKKENKEAIGQIGVSANVGNQQDAFSEQEKNYYEIQGNIELPIFDIPVSLEGYYTTQDIKRNVKSSYIRFHYDADKAKEKLMNLIKGYKGEYEQVAAKGQNLDGSYKSFLNSLSGQKESIFYQLIGETGLKDYTSFLDQEAVKNGEYKIDTTQLWNALLSKADSVSSEKGTQKTRDSVRKVYAKVMRKYEQIQLLQQKYEKYNNLLSQYKNTAYFDSILAYDKVKDLKNYEDMSYKDMAKTANSLLPDGRVTKFTTGLTNLDIGMFSKYTSKYTMGGQQVKGIDVGYDIGFATTHLTTGKTEYIGRAGEIDRYTFYAGSLKFKPILQQQLELIYYGYSPSKRMFNENKEFFKNLNTDMPTFKNPVHIFSIKQQGNISKYFHTEAEVALSNKKSVNANDSKPGIHDRMAYSLTVEGDIPRTTVSLVGSYEHTGKDFENNTLPFSFNGTDRLKVGAKMSFFKNYLHVGVEYNYLLQKNMANTFANSKLGFNIKTQSKRYPNIAVSYKPFSTYRSFSDTLAIPQRPMFGQVWTAKASYQIKKDNNIYRIMLMYNSAGNKMDTTQMKNEMFQFAFYFMSKKSMTNLSVSKLNYTSSNETIIPAWHLQNSYMISVGESYSVQKNVQTNAGVDFGVSKYGLSSIGGNAGFTYKSPKTSLTYRLSARYTQYKLVETNNWQKVIRGTLDIIWQFKYKLNDLEKTN